MARCTGIKRDLRLSKLETYANYYFLNFRSYIGQNGDSYDRYLIRMNEMLESLNIITQTINKIIVINSTISNNKIEKKKKLINPHYILQYVNPETVNKQNLKNNYNTMEDLIKHFKYWSEGFPVNSG
jgi:NADH:ubiquinone oxidoreductase subunit D